MSARAPHYLLFSASAPAAPSDQPGDWRFVLEAVDGSSKVEIADSEPDVRGERLELLAVVRGLEAIDEPARVTLVTPSRYVSRGISDGLNDWRENGWQWERHGEMVPVKNRDLWQRVDRALEFHRVECRQWRLDAPHEQAANGVGGDRSNAGSVGYVGDAACVGTACEAASLAAGRTSLSEHGRRNPQMLKWRRAICGLFERIWLRSREIGSPLFRAPWLD
ncbi:MAG TPA: RNase H family protein [Pirellulales bacterium]|jgi:ribonuclease HI|nr:RNase H family protein [Pirellulales bacterium]